MTGNEFLRRLRKIAKDRGVLSGTIRATEKGSHGRLFFGNRFTTLPDPRKEIPPGLLRGILSDFGLTMRDLR